MPTQQQVLPEQLVTVYKRRHWLNLGPKSGRLHMLHKYPEQKPLATVILLHGVAQNRFTFHLPGWSFSGWLAAHGIETWNVEMRGIGRSSRQSRLAAGPDTYIQNDLPRIIDYVFAKTGRPVFVAGHSLGGFISYAALPAVAAKVAGLITIASLARFGQARLAIQAVRWGYQAVPKVVDRQIGRLPTRPEAKLLSTYGFRRLMDSRLFRYSPVQFYYPGSMHDAQLQWWLSNAFESAPLGVFRQFSRSAAAGRFVSIDGKTDYEKIWRSQASPIPVLSICPDRDSFISVKDAVATHEITPGKDKTLFVANPETTGRHWGHVDIIHGKDAPEYIWPRIRDWIFARA